MAQAETLNNAFTQDPQLTRMYINVGEAMHSSSKCHLMVKSAKQCHECLTTTESARPAVDNSEVTNGSINPSYILSTIIAGIRGIYFVLIRKSV